MHTPKISKFAVSLAAALFAALINPAIGQDKPQTPPSTPRAMPKASAAEKTAPGETAAAGLTLATKLKGVNIVDASDKTIGEVQDVIVDPSGNSLAVIDRDHAQGGGLVLVPFELLQARLDVDRGDMKQAGEDRSEGKQPESPKVKSFVLAKAELFTTAPAIEKDRLAALDAAALEGVRNHWAGKTPEPGAVAAATKPAVKAERCSELCVAHAVGKDVKSLTDEKLGEVKDVVLDLPTGKVAYVVISAGGVLGVGETFHGVALDALVANGDDGYTLHTDRKTLDSSPGIDLDRLPSRPSLQITAKASLTDGSDAQRTPR